MANVKIIGTRLTTRICYIFLYHVYSFHLTLDVVIFPHSVAAVAAQPITGYERLLALRGENDELFVEITQLTASVQYFGELYIRALHSSTKPGAILQEDATTQIQMKIKQVYEKILNGLANSNRITTNLDSFGKNIKNIIVILGLQGNADVVIPEFKIKIKKDLMYYVAPLLKRKTFDVRLILDFHLPNSSLSR